MQLPLLLRKLVSTTQPPPLRHRSSGLGKHMHSLAAHLTTKEGARLLDISCSNGCGESVFPEAMHSLRRVLSDRIFDAILFRGCFKYGAMRGWKYQWVAGRTRGMAEDKLICAGGVAFPVVESLEAPVSDYVILSTREQISP